LACGTQPCKIEQLDGGQPFESSIGPAREPHRAHPAVPQLTRERIGPEHEPFERDVERRTEKSTPVGIDLSGQQ
jgi:hypothetical protein